MKALTRLTDFGFSRYEAACYAALVADHPSNGSQLSRSSGIARSRIYDVLRKLTHKGMVFEIEKGYYVPLPPEELKKQLRSRFESNLTLLDEQLDSFSHDASYEYILSIKGYSAAIQKAIEIIEKSTRELYVRLFPETGRRLEAHLRNASNRGVGIRYIAMGPVPWQYPIQIEHPTSEALMDKIGGESIDIIADRNEALVGVFEKDREDVAPVIWTRNRWFVVTNRDSLRHDFYHYFLHKLFELKLPLNDSEKTIYQFIKADD